MKVFALLAVLMTLAGSAVPCAVSCIARESREHCHPDDGDTHEASPCAGDPVLAVASAPTVPIASPDAGAPALSVLPLHVAPAFDAPAVALRDLPDRSPPVPPGFHVLRI